MKYETRIITDIYTNGQDPTDPACPYIVRIGYAPSSPLHGNGDWVRLPLQELQPLLNLNRLSELSDLKDFKFGLPKNCDVTLEFKAFLDGIRTGETIKKPVRERILQKAAQTLAANGFPDFAFESPELVREIFQTLYDDSRQWEAFCARVSDFSSGFASIHERHPRQFKIKPSGVRFYELVSPMGNALFVFGPYHPQPFQYSGRISEAPRHR